MSVAIRAEYARLYPAPKYAADAVWKDAGGAKVLPRSPAEQVTIKAEAQQQRAIGRAGLAAHAKVMANARAVETGGSYVGDISTFSPKQAQQSLAAVEKVISTGALKSFRVIMANGSEKTTSLETMAEWLRQKAGPATQGTSTPSAGALVNLSA